MRDFKLALKFYGPYQVVARVGKVAYRLQLPPTATIHHVFHVSMLKKKLGNHQTPQTQLPPVNDAGQFMVESVQILDIHLIKRDNKPIPSSFGSLV